MVFIMVVLGGVTRLTRSGLSMVDWKPQGFNMPQTTEEWEKEFDKYKQYPEFKMLNRDMTVDEFKSIWLMEWGHRTWGRLIGVAFAGPALYFAMRGRLPKTLLPRLSAMFALGGLQGLVGWWMVKSGLDEKTVEQFGTPRVSPYRLTAHLAMAFSVYSLLVWTGLDLLAKPIAAETITANAVAGLKRLRTPVAIAAGLIFTTAASGAFVAGNDAGHAYNDWPYMAERWIPEQIWFKELGIRNFFENTATVQFDHRMLAYSSLIAAGTVFAIARRGPGGFAGLPRAVAVPIKSMAHMAVVQVALGISTLMLYVPTHLAATHQAGAMVLWTTALWSLHALRRHSAAVAAKAARKLK
eukprot:TRINITY_DN38842_c0_g1_i1.p1 TRINITY_DN38842_c0_g1~~TRINITY_DN38842_c0_g1_i1.p1  ORF type:complete len:382 (-),score=48.54 TRINITY_DN38842_c0_g1_i1:233-1294(-)